MPITVLCPGCKSKLTAPEAAAGKKVKCPKCQAVLQVPAPEPVDDFEVVEDAPLQAKSKLAATRSPRSGARNENVAEDDFEVVEDAPLQAKSKLAATRSPRSGARNENVAEDDFEVVEDAPPKAKSKLAATRSPRSGARNEDVAEDDFEVVEDEDAPPKAESKLAATRKSAARDDDDEPPRKKRKIVEEDDEDEDDRPRKKGKKKPPAKSKLPLYIGGGVLLLILLGVGGYMLFSGGGKKEKTGAADSWVRFSAPDGSFHISFPATPTTADDLDVAEMVGQNREEAAKMRALAKDMGLSADTWMCTEGNRRYVIQMVKLPGPVPDEAKFEEMSRSENRKQLEKQGKILGEESIEMGGKSVKCLRIKVNNNGKTYITGFFILGDRGYDFTIIDDADVTASDTNAKKFIDSFRSGRPVAADPSKAGPKAKGRGR